MIADILIHLVSRPIAREIERGSGTGAFVGAIAGASTGAVATLVMAYCGLLGEFRYATYIILGVPGAICGALIFARLWPRPFLTETIRVTNYTRLATPLVVAALVAGLTVTCIVAQARGGRLSGSWWAAIMSVVILCFGLALFAASPHPLYVEIRQHIVIVRNLLTSQVYQRQQLSRWGFEVARGRYEQVPFTGTTNLMLKFEDGRYVVVPTPGDFSDAIISILTREKAREAPHACS